MATTKSSIQEARDQLFLDRAVGEFLTVVSSNLGIARPDYGFASDDLWRALVRRLALDTRQIENCFRDLLTLIFGPQKTVATVLSQNVTAADEELYVEDYSSIPQLGTLVLDRGLTTTETIEYSFRDLNDGSVELKSAAANNYTALGSTASSYLASAATAADEYLVLRDSIDFPTSGFPYSLLLDAGASTEECVELLGHATGTGDSLAIAGSTVTLTKAGAVFATSMVGSRITISGSTTPSNDGTFLITAVPSTTTIAWTNASGATEAFPGSWTIHNAVSVSALANNHSGPTVSPNTVRYSSISASGGILVVDDSSTFPNAGVVRIQEDGGSVSEDLVFVSNDLTNDRLTLKDKILNSYTTAEVSLLYETTAVEIGQVQVLGADWDVFVTSPRNVVVYIPEVLDVYELKDASYLHGPILSASSTTADGAHSIGDTLLQVADASTFPVAGVVDINSAADVVSYTILRIATVLYPNISTGVSTGGIPIGTTELFVEDAASIYAARKISRSLLIDRGGTPETVTWTAIDLATNKITVSATTSAHDTGDSLEVTSPGFNTLRLSSPLTGALTGGETIAVVENAYTGAAALEDGTNLYSAEFPTANDPGSSDHTFSGPYLWDILYRVSEKGGATTLAENVSGPTYLVASQSAGKTALEVADASRFLSPDFQEVRVGRGLAGNEKVQINDVTLARSVTSVTIASITSSTEFVVSGSSGLPEASGYRLFVDDNVSLGSAPEQIVIVNSFNSGTNTVYLRADTPLQGTHAVGDSIRLVSDVLTVDALSHDHDGKVTFADTTKLVPLIGDDWATGTVIGQYNAKYALIEEVRSYISVTSAASFDPVGGYSQINFGRGTLPAESQVAADTVAGATSITIDSSTGFPSANFFIQIGVDTRVMETVLATSRTGTTITVPALTYHHRLGEWIRYFPGEQEQIVYTGTETGANERLTFSSGISFSQDHLSGESVSLSDTVALPAETGTDFPFYLPSRWQDRIEFLIDLARAAGVKVTLTSDR